MGYLLFLRSVTDMPRACREVSEFFAFQRRHLSLETCELHGVWIEADTVLGIPPLLTPSASQASEQPLLAPESFGVSGIWELARLRQPRARPVHQVRDQLIEALRELPASGPAGVFAPVFAPGTPRSHLRAELHRLRRRYPEGLAAPLVQDRATGSIQPLDDPGL